jgi:hypothetical protein
MLLITPIQWVTVVLNTVQGKINKLLIYMYGCNSHHAALQVLNWGNKPLPSQRYEKEFAHNSQ